MTTESSDPYDRQFDCERLVKIVRVDLEDIEKDITEPSGEVTRQDSYQCQAVPLNDGQQLPLQATPVGTGLSYSSKDFKTCKEVYEANHCNYINPTLAHTSDY